MSTLATFGQVVDSRIIKHKQFTTKQKAKINKCLEQINTLLFECYDTPSKVYKLSDIYKMIVGFVEDGTASDIDSAITVLEGRLK